MPSCASINCTSRSVRGCGKTFHAFPRSRPNIMKQWLVNMKRANYVPSKSAVLCSDHFEDYCFDKTGQTTRLRDYAVPTLFKFTKDIKKERKRKRLADCTTTQTRSITPTAPSVPSTAEGDMPTPSVPSTAEGDMPTPRVPSIAKADMPTLRVPLTTDADMPTPCILSTANADMPTPSVPLIANADMPTPNADVPTPSVPLIANADMPTPNADVPTPNADVPTPSVPSTANADMPTPSVPLIANADMPTPNADVPTPSIPLTANADVPTPIVPLTANADMPTPSVPLTANADVPTPSVPPIGTQAISTSNVKSTAAKSISTATEVVPKHVPSTGMPGIPLAGLHSVPASPLSLPSSTVVATTAHFNNLQDIIPITRITKTSKQQDHDYDISDNSWTLKRKLNSAVVKIEEVKKKLKCTQQKNRRLEKKATNLESVIKDLKNERAVSPIKMLQGSLTDVHLKLLERIMNNTKRTITREEFAPDICKFALDLQSCSMKAYNYVRDSLGFVLPHPSTIRRWHSEGNERLGSTDNANEGNNGLSLSLEETNEANNGTINTTEEVIEENNGPCSMEEVIEVNDGTCSMEEVIEVNDGTCSLEEVIEVNDGTWSIEEEEIEVNGTCSVEEAIELNSGTTHCTEEVIEVNNGMTHCTEEVIEVNNGTTHCTEEVIEVNNGTTHCTEEVIEVNNGTTHSTEVIEVKASDVEAINAQLNDESSLRQGEHTVPGISYSVLEDTGGTCFHILNSHMHDCTPDKNHTFTLLTTG
uniref:uncharacterized protein isoform X1 n=2 Tax=Myxine glutinosa TaxID=7769 RepID=UPI00358F8DFB